MKEDKKCPNIVLLLVLPPFTVVFVIKEPDDQLLTIFSVFEYNYVLEFSQRRE